MTKRKQKLMYYFSVEGYTEKWYLEWLRNTINKEEKSVYNLVFHIGMATKPSVEVKKLSITSHTEIWRIFDYEGNTAEYNKRFEQTLNDMYMASKMGKDIHYNCGYSNLTFELWMLLHKTDCFGIVGKPDNYLPKINSCFDENFNKISEFKKESNFHRCLSKLTLTDVHSAIRRAKIIQKHNEEIYIPCKNLKGNYTYYKENPSLDIWKVIDEILTKCQL